MGAHALVFMLVVNQGLTPLKVGALGLCGMMVFVGYGLLLCKKLKARNN